MKKLFVFLTLMAFMPLNVKAEVRFDDTNAFRIAKAVKLGRSETASGAADVFINTGNSGLAEIDKGKDCSANCTTCDRTTGTCKVCKTGYYLKNGSCASCPSNASCSNGETFICNDYYRSSGDSCVDICNGVSCNSGYTTVSGTNTCCCESENQCGDFQVYNPTIQKCVDQVCPAGCTDMCINGCGACEEGRYLSYDTGLCPTCSSAIANCEKCTSSASGVTCTSCASGYVLLSGKCTKLQQITLCSSGQYKDSNGNCVDCPSGCAICTSATTCSSCEDGYTYLNGRCMVLDPIDPVTPVVTTGCPSGTQDCGSTGCCPTTNSCSYYADQEASGKGYQCLKTFQVDSNLQTAM